MTNYLADPAVIRTPRLALVPMDAEFMRALIDRQSERASEIGGFAVPAETLVPRWVLEQRVETVQESPALRPWLLRSIVLLETATMIGDIGFHDRPGADYLREYCDYGLEMGYSIHLEHRRQGYAREAVCGMIDWAQSQHDVRSFILSISPQNEASLRLAASIGFQKVGSHQDDVDGAEDVFLLEK